LQPRRVRPAEPWTLCRTRGRHGITDTDSPRPLQVFVDAELCIALRAIRSHCFVSPIADEISTLLVELVSTFGTRWAFHFSLPNKASTSGNNLSLAARSTGWFFYAGESTDSEHGTDTGCACAHNLASWNARSFAPRPRYRRVRWTSTPVWSATQPTYSPLYPARPLNTV